MFLSISPDDFNENYIILTDKINNNVMDDGFFQRILYSTTNYTSNGLILFFSLENIKIEKYFNKIKCHFNKKINETVINQLINIEQNLLKLNNTNKISRISEQLQNGFIKIFYDNHHILRDMSKINLILKISGIWSNDCECGITFRFFISKEFNY